jgi:endonuclease-3
MDKALMKKVIRIDKLLAQRYGEKTFKTGPDPLTELILTVLSQNTNDTNRDRAFKSMKERFPRWQDILESSPAKLAGAINVGGLAKIKSTRILKLLKFIKSEQGEPNLDFLNKWSDDKVSEYLLRIDGVGPKTAACVMAFSLGRQVMPVDTHVHRVSSRLGILPPKMTAESAHEYFLDFKDVVNLYQLHLNLIAHGRQVCRARNPQCAECNLKRLCKYYSGQVKKQDAAA